MSAKEKVKASSTKLQIIRVATRMIMENGYTEASIRTIAKEVDLSPGNVMFHFPSKEHILAVLADMLCKFQWKLIETEANDGISSVMSICLELMSMAVACEESSVAKEFFISAYQSPMCLEIIRRNDTNRSKKVFAQYCNDWTDEQFIEAETIVSGIEYATLMTTGDSASLETRISGALDSIMLIYRIPEETRKNKINKVLSIDYRTISRRILKEFIEYVENINESELEELLAIKR
ncbi:MAG: TetR/AcrR family transcriptional regulator [Clostridia bacterium]|nr:TetR/AcrR family transcriptional regulator [Clostridia bacterium]